MQWDTVSNAFSLGIFTLLPVKVSHCKCSVIKLDELVITEVLRFKHWDADYLELFSKSITEELPNLINVHQHIKKDMI